MRRIVLLSSLTPGRCFTLTEPITEFDEDEPGDRLAASRGVLGPEAVWKYLQLVEGEIEAENALGEVSRFAGSKKVSELPRQGFDRLAERVRNEA